MTAAVSLRQTVGRQFPRTGNSKKERHGPRGALAKLRDVIRLGRDGFDGWARAAADFADFEANEAPHRNVLAEVRDGLRDHLADGHRFILDVVLFVEAILFVEFFHLAGDDLLDHLLGLAHCTRLCAINVALFLEHLRRNFLASEIARIERRNVHGDIVAQLLVRRSARHEVRLAVHFHDHADFSARMNVVPHQSFAGLALCLFRGSRLALLAQNIDGLLHIAGRLHQRRATVAEARAGALAQFLHEICWYLHSCFLCTHSFSFSLTLNLSMRPLVPRNGIRCAYLQNGPALGLDCSAGPVEIYASAICLPGFLVRRDACVRRLPVLPPALRLRRNRLLVSRTARMRWCPRTRRLPPEPDPQRPSDPPPAIADKGYGLPARIPKSST